MLNSTAMSSITPRNTLNQSVSNAGVEDAHLHRAEDQRAEGGADRRAVAAGQQAAADHGGDDRLELLLQCRAARRPSRRQHLTQANERRGAGGEHEQADLHPVDRHADVARRVGSPPEAKIQLPTRVRSRIQVATAVKTTNQTIDTGTPGTIGVPSGGLAISRGRRARRTGTDDLAGEERASQSCSASALEAARPGSAAGGPGEADGQAAQDEQAGQRDDEGGQARADHDHAVDQPIAAATTKARRMPARAASPIRRRDRHDHAGERRSSSRPTGRTRRRSSAARRRREDAELGRHLEEVDDAQRARTCRVGRRRAKKTKTRMVRRRPRAPGGAISRGQSGGLQPLVASPAVRCRGHGWPSS